MSKKKTLFCICGETASGKDSLVKSLVDTYPDKFRAVCSYTNRPPRESETEGVEHYFVSKEEFETLKNTQEDKIIAYTKIESSDGIGGYEYMALEDELNKSNIYIIDPKGIKYLKEKCDHKYNIVVFYIFVPLIQRRERALESRSDFETEFEKRVNAENEQFEEFYNNKEFDYMVYNLDGMFESAHAYMNDVMISYINGTI